MEVNTKIEEIKNSLKELELEFNKLIIANPYLLKLTNRNGSSEIQKTYAEFKKYDTYKYFFLIIIGYIFCILTLSGYYIFAKESQSTELQATLPTLLKAMPFILLVLSLIISIWGYIARAILDKSAIIAIISSAIVIWIISVFSYFSKQTDNNILILFISPIVGYLIVLFSLYYIYRPLFSSTLRNTILKGTKAIQDKLDALNKSIVQESHSKVLNKIVDVESKITNGNTDFSRIHSLSVLDSLRLELIKNSINGINLVEDWKYLDLAQNMIEEIMTCNNKKITILGDLSFLSTDEGLDKLVNTVLCNDKTFHIYFTGEKETGRNSIKSIHCEELVKKFNLKYCNNPNIKKIQNNISFYPILSESFTGIGFIGLRCNTDDDNNKRYEKVYAYVSSLLITENNLDITRANPFVFSWENCKTDYFRTFLNSKMLFDKELKVLINNVPTEASNLLDCERLKAKKVKK